MPLKALTGVVTAACLALAVLAPAASAQMSLANPPPGANNFSCRPSATHPNPVVLVHGLGATMGENWGYLSPLLAARGYCVFALTYGIDPRWPSFGGVIPIEQSAPELASFVSRVLHSTHARKIDLVGHSEGTFMPQYYLKFLGGANYVQRYAAMTPLYQGTDVGATATLRDTLAPLGLSQATINSVAQDCGSCTEFLAGSPMVKKLTQGGAAVAGIQYTTIPTAHDELVVPYTSGILPAATNVTNHVLQDVCPADLSEHLAEAADPVVAQLIFNALDPAQASPVSCAGLPPLGSTPSGGPQTTSGSGPNCPRATGRLRGVGLGPVRLGMTRARVRRLLGRPSARDRRYMDFFCLSASGIRVGYASPALLRTVAHHERHRSQGRVVLALTASPYYALHGVRVGARLAAVAHRLRTGRAFHIGRNYWYLAPNRDSHAVLKVRHGVIEEIGIVDQRLTEDRRAARRLLKSFS